MSIGFAGRGEWDCEDKTITTNNQYTFTHTTSKVMRVTEHIAHKDGVLYQASADMNSNYIEWTKVMTLDEALKKFGGIVND